MSPRHLKKSLPVNFIDKPYKVVESEEWHQKFRIFKAKQKLTLGQLIVEALNNQFLNRK